MPKPSQGIKLKKTCPSCLLPLYEYRDEVRCNECSYEEDIPLDVEAGREQRPRLPGF